MDFRYSTAADAPRTDCLVLPLPEGDAALRVIAALPPAVRSQVERARKDGDFTGKLGTTQLLLLGADDAAPAPRVLLVGTGRYAAASLAALRAAAERPVTRPRPAGDPPLAPGRDLRWSITRASRSRAGGIRWSRRR